MRIENFEAAVAANTERHAAIVWLATHTALGRLSQLEIFEAFERAEREAGIIVTRKPADTASKSSGANG